MHHPGPGELYGVHACTVVHMLLHGTVRVTHKRFWSSYKALGAPLQFNFARKAPQKVARGTVIPEPSYNIPLVLAGTSLHLAMCGQQLLHPKALQLQHHMLHECCCERCRHHSALCL